MTAWLGIAVGRGELRAVVASPRAVLWAGSARYRGEGDLADALARLAGEATPRPQRARVVLERDVVQLRTIEPAPPLRRGGIRRYLGLDSPRLFRNGQGPLVTDGLLVRSGPKEVAMLAAATSEALANAIASGCEQAGIRLMSLGPAAEVLPLAVVGGRASESLALPTASGAEHIQLWGGQAVRSRRLAAVPSEPTWVPALAAIGPEAARFAGAYAATCAPARLRLLPPGWHLRQSARGRRRMLRLALATAAVWALATAVFVVRLAVAERAASAESVRLRSAVESALGVRRDLGAAQAALEAVRDARATRSRVLVLLATLTAGLGDSTSIASLRLGADSTLRLSGFAPSADAVVAALERVRAVAGARLESPSVRQALTLPRARPREVDRFAVVARLRSWP